MNFDNKVVIITGGSAGIGLATGLAFAKLGARVAIVGRNESKLKEAAERIEEVGHKPLVIKADVAKDEEAKTIVAKTIETFGKVDVLVNNAGVVQFGSILGGGLLEQYDRISGVNLRAVIHITSLAAPYLVKTKGNIVNVSSVLGASFLGDANIMAYGVSKAGLDHFTKGAALELTPLGVRVNNVVPGPTRTDIYKSAGIDRSWEEIGKNLKVQTIAEPEEVADLIVYLASDKAKSISGGYYTIDSGCMVL